MLILYCHLEVSIGIIKTPPNLVGWLVVFYVPSTAMSFRDGTTIYCPLRRTRSSVFTPFPPGQNLEDSNFFRVIIHPSTYLTMENIFKIYVTSTDFRKTIHMTHYYILYHRKHDSNTRLFSFYEIYIFHESVTFNQVT